MRMATRKPLVVMTPKSLLRHKLAVSTLDDLATGPLPSVIADSTASAKKTKRVVLCAGKVYYDLFEEAQKAGHQGRRPCQGRAAVSISAPGARCGTQAACERHGSRVVPGRTTNQGAWYQVQHHLRACLQPGQTLQYAGRTASPSPAAGHFAETCGRAGPTGRRRAGEPVQWRRRD